MQPTTIFSTKAEKYARYRWAYAPQAIDAMLRIAGITAADNHAAGNLAAGKTAASAIADIGAGTGILTHALIGRAGRVWAVEPNPEMRQLLERACGGQTGCTVLDASAEATTLPTHSVDLITVGTAFNWFDPLPTRAEFARVLRPGGWLANLRNRATGPDFGPAMQALYPPQTATQAVMKGGDTPFSFYLGRGDVQRLSFPFQLAENWPHFLGSLASASYAPDDDHPAYPAFEQRARAIFEQFSQNGILTLHGVTELEIGQMLVN